MTRIVYATRTMYAAAFVDEPQPRRRADRLRWAVRHALADACRYGDIVAEIVSINDRTLSDPDFYACAQIIREEAATCCY